MVFIIVTDGRDPGPVRRRSPSSWRSRTVVRSFPERPWLGDAMSRAADVVPVLEEEDATTSVFADRW